MLTVIADSAAPTSLIENTDWQVVTGSETIIEPISIRAQAAFDVLRGIIARISGQPATAANVISRTLVSGLYDTLTKLKAQDKGGACARVSIVALSSTGYPNSLKIVARNALYYIACLEYISPSTSEYAYTFEPSEERTQPETNTTRTEGSAQTDNKRRSPVKEALVGGAAGSGLLGLAWLVRRLFRL